jgi:hypothetical protein
LIGLSKKKVEEMIKAEITGTTAGWIPSSISTKYQDLILFTVKTALMELIETEVKTMLDSGNYKTMVDEFVKKEANRIANEWTSGEIEKRIQNAADEKILSALAAVKK